MRADNYFDPDELDRMADAIDSYQPRDKAHFEYIMETEFGEKNRMGHLSMKQRREMIPAVRKHYESKYGELAEPSAKSRRILARTRADTRKFDRLGSVRSAELTKVVRARQTYVTYKGKRRSVFRDRYGRFVSVQK